MLFSAISVKAQIYSHDFGTIAINSHPYTVAPPVINANLSGSSWTNSGSSWLSAAGSSGQAITTVTPVGTTTVNLTLTVANNYVVDITSFSFWRARSNSGAQNWSMSINGIDVGSGTIATTGSNIGTTMVNNPVTGLTGTINVTITLTGSTGNGNVRLDDFTLLGTVTSNCNSAIVTSILPANGPANTLVTIAGSGFTGATSVKFNGIDATSFTVVSDTEVTAFAPAGATTGNITIMAGSGCEGTSSVFTVPESSCSSSSSSEIYISELYDHVPGSYGVIELYNPTDNTIIFGGAYVLERAGDYNGAASYTLVLPGSIAPHSTFNILTYGTGVMGCTVATQASMGQGINGNDEFRLFKNGTLIDIARAPSNAGYTVIRKPDAVAPKTTHNTADWNYPSFNCGNLGSHTVAPSTPPPAVTPPATVTICENANATFTTTLSNPAGYSYQWKVLNAAGTWVNVVNGPNYSGATTNTLTVNAAPLSFNGNQYYCQMTSSGCSVVSAAAQLYVLPIPAVSMVTVTQPTCITPTGTITINAPLDAGLTYSINGTTFQSGTTFSGLAPGNYTVRVRNAGNCTSQTAIITINPVPGAPAVAVTTVMHPTCTEPTGTITVNSPIGTGYIYSIDGIDFQLETNFENLIPGNYIITVQNVDGCTSQTTAITVDPAPAPPAMANITVNQPTCTEPTGSITINSPIGADITYSINGVDFQAETIFEGLTPGNYTITVLNGAGCTSETATITINTAPNAPAIPTATPTHPTCNTPTGGIVINTPLGAGITYSVDGINFQPSNIFNGLAPGDYLITVQNVQGCTSVGGIITINPAPEIPQEATVTITHPDCDTPGGIITINSPVGPGINYSINGLDFQLDTAFNNVAPGDYDVTVRNMDNCTATINITINAAPGAPAVPTVQVTQPNCAVTTGTIMVNSPIGAGITYSLDGIAFQTSNTFGGLAPGNYTITVQNAAGCISVSAAITVQPVPPPPAEPVVTVTQPICLPLGQITITSPLGNGLTYSVNGSPFQSSPVFSVGPNTYTIIVKDSNQCITITSDVVVNSPQGGFIVPDIAPLEECDPENDSVEAFNIQEVINNLSATFPDAVVTAHETYDDADFHQNGTQGANPITNLSAYTNILDLTVNGTQTLYILVQSANTECYDIAELQLIIHHVPEATTPEPYELCDNGLSDTDGIAIFDLTSVTPEVLGTIDPATHAVTYHTNMNDATLNQNAIGNPAGYASSNATLYVRVTETATGCYDIVQLELIVNPLPVANNPEPYTLCDVNNPGDEREVFDLTSRTEEIIILADGTLQDGINLTFHHTLADAQGEANAIATPEAYINQTTVEAIYVRVTVEATGCYRVVLLDIRVEPLPLLVAPSDDELTICDPDADGFAQFDLQALVADMVNNAPNLVVRFYESAIDAANSQNAIPNPDDYTNIVPFAQTIYVRVENTATGCFTTTAYALDLVVVPSPQLPDLADLTLCDTDNNNQNAITAFDLTSQDAIILAALGGTAADYTITYYTSLANAENGAPRITNTVAYQGQDGQQVWVRVVDNTNPAGCFSIGTFFLRVNTPLALAPSHLWTKCNSELPNDTTEVFDLTLMDDTILGPFGVGLGYTVNYYTTDPRVDPAATPITPATAYTNPTNPVTLFVEVVTTGEGDCKSYTTLTLRVLPLPTPNFAPDALTMCDNNNSPDGVEVFDLTLAAADIINNEPNLVLSYHTTLEDANNDTNAIPVPTAYESGTATIYVRVEANTNNPANAVCYQVVELELIVNPLPALGENGVIPPFAQCEPNTDGRGTFILSEHIPVILPEGANADDYTVRFYFDQAALAAGTALPNQYNNIASPQQILVWVRHDETGCIATGTMDLLVEEAALANTPDPAFLETCDDDGNNDGVHTFDLTLFNSDILGTQSPTDYSVSYYESLEDAEAGTNAIADPANYTNGFSPYLATIYARVTNEATISGCHAITSVELIVEALPEPNITSEGGQTICVDFKTGVVINPLTLYSNVEGAGYTYQWYFNGTLIPGTDPSSSSYDATVEGAYSVVVTGPSHLACVSDMSTAFTVIKSGPASPIGEGFSVSGAFSESQTIEVSVEGYGVYEYRLDGDGPWQSGNVFTNVSPGDHIIYVRDVKATEACDIIEIHSVSVIDYPNYFTPNGDGYHDTWNIIGLASQTDAKIYIFDRYGKLIKQIAANGEGWDGTYNGAQLPADDYWFTVTYRETVNGTETIQEFKSHFALKR